MGKAIVAFAVISLVFGACALEYVGFLGLTIAFSAITLAIVIGHYLEMLREQMVEIAKAHFDRQHHEETLK